MFCDFSKKSVFSFGAARSVRYNPAVLGRLTSKSIWGFGALSDFADVLRWLQQQRRNGRADQGLTVFTEQVSEIVLASIDEYQRLLKELDDMAGGVLAAPGSAYRPGLNVSPTTSVMEQLEAMGKKLHDELVEMARGGDARRLQQWMGVFADQGRYVRLLQDLVGRFGNFEVILPTFPGTGELIRSDDVQQRLARLYFLNTRNLRLLEMGRSLWQSWRGSAGGVARAFFEPDVDVSQLTRQLLLEYMIQADPVRIEARKQRAQQKNKSYQPYRFWRAAENLRLMAVVEYVDGPKRRPSPRRRYVQLQADAVRPIVADLRRLEWSLKEVFNNSLSASSIMRGTSGGQWKVAPLPRHQGSSPSYAIRLGVRPVWMWRTLLPKRGACITILDEGVGIAPEDVPHVTKWGYSPRREYFRQKARRSDLSREEAWKEIQIGGKGIGLAYAQAVVTEHGGRIVVQSEKDQGTRVDIYLPTPTPLKL